ncbi:DUF3122 domain-containing protein [Nostoc parmelioides]|uniref:DUF3122 domain-containing protein n=1 Tax=Nostoc parmelioides FACHB-3921 TaxID=2692909 RepID=A0ABR8BP73_9NOSO|nr:DUF3122 domain-containing protein [Nostoc parmelioides]MBD2255575.1 DUF3122 domain-containing protein [Nostoc parmelioides FACHB-3921]
MKTVLRFIGSTFILGMLVWALTINLVIAPVQAAIRQLEEAPGQTVYQSRQTLKDQQGNSWQAIAFKRTHPDRTATLYLRLVGFPGTANLDHSQPITLTDSMGKTFTAADVSHDMFMDQTQMEPDAGQYDLQPILMQLESAIPLRLILPSLDQSEIILNVSPNVVEEWRSLTVQK